MRRTILVIMAIAAVVLSTPAWAAGDDSDKKDVMAVVNRFVDSFNKGDSKAAEALLVPDAPIIDEVPPYVWKGAGSFGAWLNDYDADAKKRGITDGHVTLGKPKHIMVSDKHAYAVIPSDYTYKEKGKTVKQTGSMFTLTLRKDPSGWIISGWSWSTN